MDPRKLKASSPLEMKGVAAAVQTHLGGQGAASGPSHHRICYTHWSRAAGTRPPAPTLRRWSTPPCSRQTVASPPRDVSQAAKQFSGALRLLMQRLNSREGLRKQGGAGLTERHHPTWERGKRGDHDYCFTLSAVNQEKNRWFKTSNLWRGMMSASN